MSAANAGAPRSSGWFHGTYLHAVALAAITAAGLAPSLDFSRPLFGSLHGPHGYVPHEAARRRPRKRRPYRGNMGRRR